MRPLAEHAICDACALEFECVGAPMSLDVLRIATNPLSAGTITVETRNATDDGDFSAVSVINVGRAAVVLEGTHITPTGVVTKAAVKLFVCAQQSSGHTQPPGGDQPPGQTTVIFCNLRNIRPVEEIDILREIYAMHRVNITHSDTQLWCLKSEGPGSYKIDSRTLKTKDAHPNIASFLSFSMFTGDEYNLRRDKRVYAMAMEYHQLDLHTLLFTKDTYFEPTTESTLNILAQLICGIDNIHKQGFVHTDLKPGNILLNVPLLHQYSYLSIETYDVVKIADLGMAVEFGEPLRGGTYGYEDLFNRNSKTAAVSDDLYAFGVIALEIVTRRRCYPRTDVPFDKDTHITQNETVFEALLLYFSTHQLSADRIKGLVAFNETLAWTFDNIEIGVLQLVVAIVGWCCWPRLDARPTAGSISLLVANAATNITRAHAEHQ